MKCVNIMSWINHKIYVELIYGAIMGKLTLIFYEIIYDSLVKQMHEF